MEPHVLLPSAALVTLIFIGVKCSPFVNFTKGNLYRDSDTLSSAVLMSRTIWSEGLGRRSLNDPSAGQLNSFRVDESPVKVRQDDSKNLRRSLLSSLLDISPPGLWPVGDDQDDDDRSDDRQSRALLHDVPGTRALLVESNKRDTTLR